jgi:maltooligosyltrehalose synthase
MKLEYFEVDYFWDKWRGEGKILLPFLNKPYKQSLLYNQIINEKCNQKKKKKIDVYT